LTKNRLEWAKKNGAHAPAAFNEGGFLLFGGWAGCRLELGPEVFELLHADRLERAIVQESLGQTNGLVSKQDHLG
jgi:hypothetical protein